MFVLLAIKYFRFQTRLTEVEAVEPGSSGYNDTAGVGVDGITFLVIFNISVSIDVKKDMYYTVVATFRTCV